MTAPRNKRTSVVHRGQRVPGLYVRTLGNGSEHFEWAGRIDGRMRSQVLEARTVSEALREVVALRAGTRVQSGKTTLGELADAHFERQQSRVGSADERRRRSQRTVDTGRHRFDRHVRPSLGNRAADSLTVGDLAALVNRWEAAGLAPATASGTLSVLSAVLSYGVQYEGLQRNVVRDLPRDDRPGTARTKEPRYLSADEGERLLFGTHRIVADDGRDWDAPNMSPSYRAVGALCLYQGLRVSEALGLRWLDVDFDAGTLTVKSQRAPDGGLVPLKTRASRRTLRLRPAVVRELRAVQDREAARVEKAREDGRAVVVRLDRAGLIFPSANRNNARRAITTAAGYAGLNEEGRKTVSPHDLRHSYAAACFDAGLSPVEIAGLLGHASPRVTLTVYAGLIDSGLDTAADKLAASGFGA